MGQGGAQGPWQSTPTLSGHPARLLRGENSGGQRDPSGAKPRGGRGHGCSGVLGYPVQRVCRQETGVGVGGWPSITGWQEPSGPSGFGQGVIFSPRLVPASLCASANPEDRSGCSGFLLLEKSPQQDRPSGSTGHSDSSPCQRTTGTFAFCSKDGPLLLGSSSVLWTPKVGGVSSPQRMLAEIEQRVPNGGSVASSLLALAVPGSLWDSVGGAREGGSRPTCPAG